MGRGEIHIELVVDFADDPKVRALSRYGRAARTARDLYVQMICYCKRNKSDGFVPHEQIGVLVYPDPPSVGERDVKHLADVGLIVARNGGWYVPAYLKRNKSAAEIRTLLNAKSDAAARTNHERWHERRGQTDPRCPICIAQPSLYRSVQRQTSDDDPIAIPIGGRKGSDSPETETETETETEQPPNPPPAKPARRGRPTDDPDFDRFWAAYPKKADKGHALDMWRRHVIKGGADPEAVIAGAERYRDDPTRKPDYTKNPGTWLNGLCWNDQPSRPPRGQRPFWEN